MKKYQFTHAIAASAQSTTSHSLALIVSLPNSQRGPADPVPRRWSRYPYRVRVYDRGWGYVKRGGRRKERGQRGTGVRVGADATPLPRQSPILALRPPAGLELCRAGSGELPNADPATSWFGTLPCPARPTSMAPRCATGIHGTLPHPVSRTGRLFPRATLARARAAAPGRESRRCCPHARRAARGRANSRCWLLARRGIGLESDRTREADQRAPAGSCP